MRRFATVFAGGVLALALSGAAIAGPLEDGVAAAKRGDNLTALRLIRRAAEQGDVEAQQSLGSMYYVGVWGLPQDYVQAHLWFNVAASRAPFAELRNKMIMLRDRVAAKMTSEQVAEAQQLAREWKPSPRAAEMPALKQSYVDQCDDEPGGKCSADEMAALLRNIQHDWDEATDSARTACAPQTTERGMSFCLQSVKAGVPPECSADDPCRKP